MSTDHIAKQEITIDAPADKVWNALTDPEIIKQYMFGTEAVSDWKEGSTLTFSGEYEGKKYKDKGTILKIEKEKLLRYIHFSDMSGKEDKPENYNTVTYELSGDIDNTRVSVSQDNNPDEKAKEHSEKNWGMMLKGLKKAVEK